MTTSAQALLRSALAVSTGTIYIDLADAKPSVRAWLEASGFALQRPFTRMLLGRSESFDDVARTYAVIGPELRASSIQFRRIDRRHLHRLVEELVGVGRLDVVRLFHLEIFVDQFVVASPCACRRASRARRCARSRRSSGW